MDGNVDEVLPNSTEEPGQEVKTNATQIEIGEFRMCG